MRRGQGKSTSNNRKPNMTPPETRNHTPVRPQHHNADEPEENDLKNIFKKMLEDLKEDMRKSLKEIEDETNQKIQETVQDLKTEIETIKKVQAEEMLEIEKLGENINIYWSPDGQTVAVGNKDDVVTFIDAKTYRSKAEEQFKFEVNEISWNNDNNMFFLTNGNDFINILSYPKLKPVQSINAHPSNCICIKFDPMGKYFATGSADALVSLWDVDGLVCVRCFSRLDWPVRTLSFSHNGKMLASASEDHFIDVAEVETEDKLWEVQRESLTFTVVWHPKRPLLAFACNDKDGKYDSSQETGTVKLFGLPNDS
ncbi:THO complex subunit 3-like protein [Cricetulus griseus]|uniref:THO complex subunit 3-like protein n=1 Tax=Cricetulus griseus TaxID=10029 RepID=A0A061HVW6_CRIGR|nr:THO complex subunit 3-like protein [Cricetulus griseus]